jgi:DNA-binding MarR family transcriptional regulator
VLRSLPAGGSTVTSLAAIAGTTGPAMSKATAALEQRWLISRTDNPDDARSRQVQLTAAGRRVVRAIAAAESTALARWERQVGSKDLAAVRRALQSFVDDRPVERTATPRRLRFE